MESGSWEVVKKLAEGGEGALFLAVTPEGRRVAVKVTHAPALSLEFQTLSKLRHPALISVLGYSKTSAGILGQEQGPCYWMEYLEGPGLLEAAKGCDPDRIFAWLMEALEGLAYLHRQGLVHGDLSPSNILFDSEGHLKVVDFGSAAALPYAAPERAGGNSTPAADVFSLGTIFYEALAGIHPRAGARRLADLCSLAAKPLADVARGLREKFSFQTRVIDRMIQTDRRERFGDAQEVLEALRGHQLGPKSRSAINFYSSKLIGAEPHFRRIELALKSRSKKSTVFAVHGGIGVGKTRFLNEVVFSCALEGAEVTILRALDEASPQDLARLFDLAARLPSTGRLILLEWNDDRISGDKKGFLEGLVRRLEAEEIVLSNLSEGQTQELLTQAFSPQEAAEFAPPLFRQTHGNPLILCEIAGLLLERASEGGKRPSLRTLYQDVDRIDSLSSVLQCKLKGLDETDRRILAAISVAHDSVDAASLERVVSVSDFTPRILRLMELHLVTRGRHAAFTLVFPALGKILAEHYMPRTPQFFEAIHRAWLEALASEPPGHIQKVRHALALKDRVLVRAGACLAAESLAQQGRGSEALELVNQSLPLTPTDDADERSRLMRLRINLLNDLGRFEAALEACEEWKALEAHDEPERLREAKYWFITGLDHLNLHNDDEAARRLGRFVETADPEDDAYGPYLIRAASLLGLQEMRRQNLAEAEAHFRRGLELAGPKERRRAELLRNLAELKARQKMGDEAKRLFEESRTVYREFNDQQGIFSTDLQEGNWAINQGDEATAERLYREAEETARTHGLELQLGLVWSNQAWLSLLKKKYFEALSLLGRAIELLSLSGNRPQVEIAQKLRNDVMKALESEKSDTSEKTGEVVMNNNILRQLRGLHRELLREADMEKVLNRLMDGALDLSKAEGGFLVLESAEPGGVLPGYRIAVARHLPKKAPKSKAGVDFGPSLSAVRRALASEQVIVTDNAMIDEIFRDAKSVQVQKLRSILAVPVRGVDHVIGVFYLDHRFEEGLFGPETVAALETFADMAALALQKGRMIEELRKNNRELVDEIEIKTSEMGMLEREVKSSRQKLKKEYGEIIGHAPKMIEVLELVDRITDAKIPVWIYGESGTGKESIARALHFNSPRSGKPFVTENCSALPENLLESELFGHKKGSFTHAMADKKGILQYAEGGTIFLDEIADMSLGLQAKLLRFLQEGEIRPVGSNEVITVDVRVVSASNRELARLVREKKFREDLYFRLNGVTVRLPALRERLEDLPLLADHFLKEIAEREGKKKCRLAPETLRIFLKFDWPGNIRELQNTLETAVLFAEKEVVTPASLAFKSLTHAPEGAARAAVSQELREAAAAVKPDLLNILKALRDEGFHRGHAAKSLGISLRTLYARLERHNVPRNQETLKNYVRKYLD